MADEMQALGSKLQQAAVDKVGQVAASTLELQDEAQDFAEQLQQLQQQQQWLADSFEQQRGLLAANSSKLQQQQQQQELYDKAEALLEPLRQHVLELQQQVLELQERQDTGGAAGRAAVDASGAAASAADTAVVEVGSLREQVQRLESQLAELQQQGLEIQQPVAELHQQLQQLAEAIQHQQQQQQLLDLQLQLQQQEQLSAHVAELAAGLRDVSEAVHVALPLRLVEVEDRVAETAQTCADAVKVSGSMREGPTAAVLCVIVCHVSCVGGAGG
jgi:chromosome segregation ATPase